MQRYIFCRELDIRVAKVMKAKPRDAMLFRKTRKLSGEIVRVHPFAQLVHEHISIKGIVIAVAADFFC